MISSLRLFRTIPLLLILASSCGNKKNTTQTVAEENKTPIVNTDDVRMKELGFVIATVKDFSKEDGCGYLIVLNESEQILQTLKPLALSFQKDGLQVWIKYRPIRPIAPACKKGTPIDLEEIKKV